MNEKYSVITLHDGAFSLFTFLSLRTRDDFIEWVKKYGYDTFTSREIVTED